MGIQPMDWNEEYKSCSTQKPRIDLWLDKHSHILEKSRDLAIMDLGCGLGNDSLYLSERNYKVMSCDISEIALDRVKEVVPNAKTLLVDMLKGLPFETSSASVILCDLSLHYFYWNDTVNIVKDISRVLTADGYLLCRLNSSKDINYGAGQGVLLEENYYFVNGNTKRFFSREQIEKLFCSWDIEYLSEYQMNRYQYPKILWEVAVKKSQKII